MKRKSNGSAPSTRLYKKSRARTGVRSKRRSTLSKRRYGRRMRKPAARRGSKRRFVAVAGQETNHQLSVTKRVLNKRPRVSLTQLNRQSKIAIQKNYYRYQGVQPLNNTGGYFLMDRGRTLIPPANGSAEQQPLWLFQITGLPANQAVTGPSISHKMKYTWTGAGLEPLVQFDTLDGQNAQGATGTNYWIYENIGVSSSPTPGRADILEYADLRVNCVGANNLPTNWKIDIVSFKFDWLVPEYQFVTMTGDNDWSAIRAAVYTQLNRNQVTNPVQIQGKVTPIEKYVKFHHSLSFWQQPSSTDDADVVGPQKIIKLFKWFNLIQNYAWQQSAIPQDLTNLGTNAGGFAVDQGLGNVAAMPAPKDRLYLMVRSTNQIFGVYSANTTPSFDVCMRVCHRANAQLS